MAKIVHDYGGKYISDEVQTGAGRCGQDFFLTKTLDLQADMITMAKGFGNGAAIGGVLMKTEVSDTLAGKAYFNTFGGDPFQVLQAKLTMEIIREEKLIENAKNMGALLRDGLLQLMGTHRLIGDVRGRGLLMGMEFVKDRTTKIPAPQEVAGFMDACLARGLLLGKGGLMGNVVRIAPPLSINKEQIDFMLETMDQALAEVGRKKWK